MVVLIVFCLGVDFLCCKHLMCIFVFLVKWQPIGKMAVHSAYNMFS